MTESLTLAVIGHLVGDYLLQSDWMALNKKKRTTPCVIHCVIWTLCVGLFSGWLFYQNWTGALIGLVLFTTHFIQDRTQIILFWMTRIMAPWSIIVVDNVWHIVTLWFVWKFIA